ncbi:MAG: hypothetical protein Hyperionvirus15_31 [Hyperionvirus sp.]|uniref:Uncharacterized protein n=1 Tax=Hyperionvirus sp. TaxID=2487770 RepID=A0A3G5ADN0_9VIRU|nr:MAG: hypothetical protein Hyperionvirus15_31 [Hyperionvirus sp.]
MDFRLIGLFILVVLVWILLGGARNGGAPKYDFAVVNPVSVLPIV